MKLALALVLFFGFFSSNSFANSVPVFSITGLADQQGGTIFLRNMEVCSKMGCNIFYTYGSVIELSNGVSTYGGLLVTSGWNEGFLNPDLLPGTFVDSNGVINFSFPLVYVDMLGENLGIFIGKYDPITSDLGTLTGDWAPPTTVDEPSTVLLLSLGLGLGFFSFSRRKVL